VLTLYMQLGEGFSPLRSATVVLPMSLTFAVVSRLAGPRAQRKGPVAIIEGCCVQIVGLAIIAAGVAAGVTSSPTVVAALLIVFAVGQAMAMAPLYALVLGRIPAAHAGSGAGVLSTVQQIGNGTGAAVVGALYFSARGTGSDQTALLLCLGVLAAALAVTVGLLLVAGARVAVGPRRAAPAAAAGD
jgi:hypothetical protein